MSENIHITCSFCGRNKQDTEVLIAGANAHICNACIEQAFQIVEQDSKSSTPKPVEKPEVTQLKSSKSELSISLGQVQPHMQMRLPFKL